nr:unnamed protein product [Digitaria exilis]
MLSYVAGVSFHAQGSTCSSCGKNNYLDNLYCDRILTKLQRLGASFDLSNNACTMASYKSKIVTESFVKLHEQQLVYRDVGLVNWDCTLQTAIPDIEVRRIDVNEGAMIKVPGYPSSIQFGVLVSFAYRIEEGLGEIVVETTRIETMLADTAIAVHPDDQRYKHLHGKCAVHPFNGRRLQIICDTELEYPTSGAVKIAPGHDPNAFEVGKRHGLEFVNIFTDDGKINHNGGEKFVGLRRFDARTAVILALKDMVV